MKETPSKILKTIILFTIITAINYLIYLIIFNLTINVLKWLTVFTVLVIFTYIALEISSYFDFLYITYDDDSSANQETKSLILHDKIIPKKMFYNQRELQAISALNSLLSEENYHKVIDRLNSRGMRKGFACLFSGGPGTGKTETAYQIARETKRHIMMIDISQTRDCLWGEDEKKIKGIFDSYRTLVENSEVTPILLFNEADSIINKRTELGKYNRALDKSENTVQNIILSELENFTGILIATTNLSQNMDIAFERRFLYRITFDKPCIERRREIWKAQIPELPEELCQELSKKYELSGGQIENIARKVAINSVLNDNVLPMETLLQYCKEESLSSIDTSKRIGF